LERGYVVKVLEQFSLRGRRALVTGGNRGLGKSFVRALVEAGAEVCFISRDGAENAAAVGELETAGLSSTAFEADLTVASELRDSMAAAVSALGGLDILVNNAGVCFHREALGVPEDEWDQVFDLNVKALFNCSVVAANHMKSNGGGSIVNIGSMSGTIVNRPQFQPAYNASKAAVHHLTKSLAAEWAPHGIRVNAVAPGYVKTAMTVVSGPEFERYWIDDAPMKRMATPEEIAPSVIFLASDAASFITGSILVADGGYSTW
jgi:NAD(P)-dependent dehydrogenase (short-subunit alcohol dehydrogenase family)